MKNTKRLFLFAGYDKGGIIDSSLTMSVCALSKFGDVVLYMDSDCPPEQLEKLSHITLYAGGNRHGEYDFGSYKRAYNWARNNLNLSDYDFVYMVNDSVYGPLFDLTPYLQKMENQNTDAFGIAINPHHQSPHIQSWFIGMRQTVFLSDWFCEFLNSVRHHDDKGTITVLYEHGFTKRLIERNMSWSGLYKTPHRSVYNRIKHFYKRKMPFMKKMAISRHYGSLGAQVLYVLNHLSAPARNAIMENANRIYGTKYMETFLTRNPFKIMYRNIRYIIHKLLNEGI